MKKFSMFLFAAMLVFGLVSNVAAYSNSGTFMFKLNGNDSNTDFAILESQINEWFSEKGILHDEVDIDPYSKVDAVEKASATSNAFMTLTYEADHLSGHWFTDEAVEFYSVKAGTEFAFYWVENGATSGIWSTEDLLNKGGNIPQISHLSTWNTVTTTDPPVGDSNNAATPEPATMVLLGIGLMGIAVVGRKAKK